MKIPRLKLSILYWLVLGISILSYLFISFVSDILIIGLKLRAVYPPIELFFYVVIILIILFLVLYPIVVIINRPTIAFEDLMSVKNIMNSKVQKKIAKQLLRSNSIPDEYRKKLVGQMAIGSDLSNHLQFIYKNQIDTSKQLIRDHAVLVFVSTAISQNGRLDSISVLMANFRMINKLTMHYGFRPSTKLIFRIYLKILISALIADRLEDIDIEGITEQIGLGAISAIPGTTFVVGSFLDGLVNGFITLRIGITANKYLIIEKTVLRKTVNVEARKELNAVVKSSIASLPDSISRKLGLKSDG